MNVPGNLAAGIMAGSTEAVLIVTPFEVVKTRLQQQKGMPCLCVGSSSCIAAS